MSNIIFPHDIAGTSSSNHDNSPFRPSYAIQLCCIVVRYYMHWKYQSTKIPSLIPNFRLMDFPLYLPHRGT